MADYSAVSAAVDVADAEDEEEEIIMDEPAPEVSWKVVSIMYACSCAICAVLAALQFGVHIEQVEGVWLIFAPFWPCLAYSLHRMRKQFKESKLKAE